MPSRSRSRSQPPPDLLPAEASRTERRLVHRAELRCYLCAELAGVLERLDGASAFAPVARFAPADGAPPRPLAWRALRCLRCGGSLFLDAPETVVRRVEHVNWALDRPRRGRPPKWLVALRRQHEAA